jgi:ketosteroid isomerase-like protein
MAGEPTMPDVVALTRAAFVAVNRCDLDAVMTFFAPDGVLDGRALDGLWEGRAAIRGFLDVWFGSFTELHMEAQDLDVVDDGVVLAVVTQVGRPVGGDHQVHQREGWAIRWSPDGLIVRLTTHSTIDEARAAVGV